MARYGRKGLVGKKSSSEPFSGASLPSEPISLAFFLALSEMIDLRFLTRELLSINLALVYFCWYLTTNYGFSTSPPEF